MSDYTLTINFTNEQLQTISDTGAKVCIGKSTGGGVPNIIWQSLYPFQTNRIEWTEEYGIYISNTKIEQGASIQKLSSTPIGASTDKLYTLEPSGIISGPDTGGAPDAFALLNNYNNMDYMTVGLFQDASVNSVLITGNAMFGAPVLLASTAIMTPSTTLYIWLQSDITDNSVTTIITSPTTELKFGGGVNQIAVAYDTQSGQFIPV